MAKTFVDFVDLERIRSVFESFYEFTGIPPSLTDMQGNVLVGVAWQRICAEFHRRHEEGRKRCVESDTQLAARLDADKGYSCYHCLNGLVDVAMPIVIDGEHMANLFTGQFFFEPPDKERFREQAREMGFDEQEYMAALDEVPVFPQERVEKAVRFLADLGALITRMGITHKRMHVLNEQLEQEVERRTERLQQEVKDREQAQQDLALTLSEYETVFANSSVGILHIKGGRRIHRVNRRFLEIFGYESEAEVKGRSTRVLHVSQRGFDAFGRQFYNPLARNDVVRAEYQMRRKNGSLLWCLLSGRAVNPPHMEQGAIWVIEDISERKALETLRLDMDRITRHDIKAPISGIVAMARALLLDDNLTPEQKRDLKLVEETGLRLNDQINLSLDLLRMESGEYEVHPEPVDLVPVLDGLCKELAAKAQALGVSLRAQSRGKPLAEAKPVMALGEESLTRTVFANLLHNAMEASPRGGEALIQVERETGKDGKEWCVVRMRNAGVVPEPIRDDFFSKYISMGKPGGSGLGTYSARVMTEIQGGDIAMATSEEEGTMVSVRLPGAGS